MSLKRILTLLLGSIGLTVNAASVTLQITDQEAQAVEGAVLELHPSSHQPSLTKLQAAIDQINKEYVPRVVVVHQGGSVNFPNKDDIKHHVYSFSSTKQFELPLYEGTPANPVTFDKPGVVVLGCNIHDWMRGYIYVAGSPYAAKSDANGKIKLTNLPADNYQVRIWHPQLEKVPKIADMSLSATDSESLSINLELKPLIKIRRNPAARRRGYD